MRPTRRTTGGVTAQRQKARRRANLPPLSTAHDHRANSTGALGAPPVRVAPPRTPLRPQHLPQNAGSVTEREAPELEST